MSNTTTNKISTDYLRSLQAGETVRVVTDSCGTVTAKRREDGMFVVRVNGHQICVGRAYAVAFALGVLAA